MNQFPTNERQDDTQSPEPEAADASSSGVQIPFAEPAGGTGSFAPRGAQPLAAGGFGAPAGGDGFSPPAGAEAFPVAASPARAGVISKIGKGTMLLFAALMLGVVTVAVLSHRPAPQSAGASQQMLAQVDRAVREYNANPSAAQKRTQELFGDTDAIEKAFYGFADRTQVPTDDLKQNPFVHLAAKDPDKEKAAQEASWREKQRQDEEARKKLAEQKKKVEAALKQVTIQTILYSDDNPMVLISNRVYRAGDQLGLFVIAKINRNSIVLQVGDDTYTKTLD